MTQDAEDIIETANQELTQASEEPMTIDEFLDELLESPQIGASSHRYLLNAIDYFGTREVIEQGENKERYTFFDDPGNDGQHAVLGNTDMLNAFIRDLRAIANSEERMQKIILFSGPTATGKSELKRCIVNGLREYSKTEQGRRYTCDWNVSSLTEPSSGLGYTDSTQTSLDESEWFTSPVQTTPLSILPQKTRNKVQQQVAAEIPTEIDLDPFSREAYDTLTRHYQQEGTEDMFSAITNPRHLRIRRYTMDETMGVGILTAEDDGSVKERLVGEWMPSMFQMLDSRGRKNPQAFSYDGVLAQGNGGVTVVEDASNHIDLLVHLLNIPDESHAKIDKKIGIDVDTVPLFISNPDLRQQLDKNLKQAVPIDKIHSTDPLKALKRRINQYNFTYLTGLESEVRLLHSELIGSKPRWDDGEEQVHAPVHLSNTEFAPHTIEAAAMYNVVSRLSRDDLPTELTLADKALLFDHGYIETEKGRVEFDNFDFDDDSTDGEFGIPITYTRDRLRSLVHESEATQLPTDVLDSLTDGLDTAPVFSDPEVKSFKQRVEDVKEYVHNRQEEDVLESILRERRVTEDAINDYVESVYNYYNDEPEDEDYDTLEMKIFEVNHLGMSDDDYTEAEPNEKVVNFRHDRIIQPLNSYVWRQRGSGFEMDEIPLKEIPLLSSLIGRYNWKDVFRTYEEFEPLSWDNPPENTQTEHIKMNCVTNMVELYDYTEESARRTCERVVERARPSLEAMKKQHD